MVTDQAGNLISRHDFLPFGEEIQAGSVGRDNYFGQQDFVKQMFTGQSRDQETGLDFFNARYLSAPQGRFLSPDPENLGARLTDPQSWNGYSYVRNNPLTLIDPTGADICPDGSEADACVVGGDSPDVPIDPDPCIYFECGTGGGYGSGQLTRVPPPPQRPNPLVIGPGNNRNVFTCASESANKISLAGGLQRFGIGTSGVGGFITNSLAGNAFSGLTDLVQSFGSGEAGGHNVFYNMGQGLAAGPSQGFGAAFGNRIEGTPWASGPVDVVSTALAGGGMKTITGARQTLQTINGAVKLGTVLGEGAEYGTGVGEVKLGYDFLTWAGSLAGCAGGIIQ